MYRVPCSLALLGSLTAWTLVRPSSSTAAGPQNPPAGQQQAPKKNSKAKSESSSMTGCIDEQDGRYVLIDDRTRATIANLEAEGFPTEGFAKHVGHKVTVRGTVNPGDVPLFRVRSVETIRETCEPQLYQ